MPATTALFLLSAFLLLVASTSTITFNPSHTLTYQLDPTSNQNTPITTTATAAPPALQAEIPLGLVVTPFKSDSRFFQVSIVDNVDQFTEADGQSFRLKLNYNNLGISSHLYIILTSTISSDTGFERVSTASEVPFVRYDHKSGDGWTLDLPIHWPATSVWDQPTLTRYCQIQFTPEKVQANYPDKPIVISATLVSTKTGKSASTEVLNVTPYPSLASRVVVVTTNSGGASVVKSEFQATLTAMENYFDQDDTTDPPTITPRPITFTEATGRASFDWNPVTASCLANGQIFTNLNMIDNFTFEVTPLQSYDGTELIIACKNVWVLLPEAEVSHSTNFIATTTGNGVKVVMARVWDEKNNGTAVVASSSLSPLSALSTTLFSPTQTTTTTLYIASTLNVGTEWPGAGEAWVLILIAFAILGMMLVVGALVGRANKLWCFADKAPTPVLDKRGRVIPDVIQPEQKGYGQITQYV